MRIVLILSLFVMGTTAFAQSSILKSGIQAFDSGDFELAVEQLSQAMEKPAQLKSKELADGWFYLGKSKATLISTAMSLQDGEMLTKYRGYDLDAYACYNNALKSDPKGDLKERLELEITSLYYVIFNSGNVQYLLGENSEALKYYNTAATIAETYSIPGDYQVYSLRGQTQLAIGDSTSAYTDFAHAIKRYAVDSPEIPDANIGYAYYSMAIIERYSNENLDKALELTQVGNEVMQSEMERLKSLLNDGSSDQRVLAAQEAQFESITDALNRFELDIYNASPQKYDEAVAKFKKALAENPKDANLRVVYGNLIEYKEPDEAYNAYLKAIEIDPSLSIAYFNAGANRVNEGVKYARKANEEVDYQKSQEWQKKVNEQFQLALPNLKKAHELESDNIYILDALLQVTMQLEMYDDYKLYKEKQKQLKGY